jgi:hypothetical protein
VENAVLLNFCVVRHLELAEFNECCDRFVVRSVIHAGNGGVFLQWNDKLWTQYLLTGVCICASKC